MNSANQSAVNGPTARVPSQRAGVEQAEGRVEPDEGLAARLFDEERPA